MTISSIAFSFIGGLLSVLSPCVLPVIPIILTGRENDSKLRPLLIVIGLSITFILMGIVSTLFGQIIAPYIYFVEKLAGIIILLFGLLFLFNINVFKKVSIFNKLNYHGQGAFSGLILGATLGIIWIPCVGPVLTSILAMVATSNDLLKGVILLTIYSIGFSIPLLIAGYFSHFFRKNVTALKMNPLIVRIVSGSILIIFGIYILLWGMI
jgi:cytochrome c-type biogenesis protein